MASPATGNPIYDIVVVGAGPAGLTAALSFARDGHSVTVLERHAKLQSPGGPLTVQSPASKCLIELGAKDILQKNNLKMDSMAWWSYKENKPMAVVPIARRSSRTPHHRVNRPLIQKILYTVAVEAGAKVVFGKNLEGLEEANGKVRLWTQDGEEYTADLVVGGDGIKSKVRRLIFPDKNVESIPTEECIFLTQVPGDILKADPRVAPLLLPDSFQITMGPGRFHNTSRHISGNYAMTLTVMKYGPPGAVDGNWNKPADLDELRDLYKEFNEPTRAYLEHVTEAEQWQMAYGRELDSWHSAGGHVVLVGDAAHAMLPHKAMGLSQGIEDSAALGRMFRLANKKGIPFVTRSYEKIRRPRVEKIVSGSVANAGRNALPDGPVQEARDRLTRAMNGTNSWGSDADWDNVIPDRNAPPRSPELEKWENDHDVLGEVDEFMEEALKSSL